MELDFELERKQIAYLQAAKNYSPPKYLQQFNAKYQEKIIAEIPTALNWSLPKYQIKTQPCNCVKCGKIYNSEQSAEEMGMCWACHFADSQKCLDEMDRFEALVENKPKSYMPTRIGEETMWGVQKYFRERLDGKMKKNQVWKVINEHFGLDLTQRETLALLDVNAINLAARKRGYLFNQNEV